MQNKVGIIFFEMSFWVDGNIVNHFGEGVIFRATCFLNIEWKVVLKQCVCFCWAGGEKMQICKIISSHPLATYNQNSSYKTSFI